MSKIILKSMNRNSVIGYITRKINIAYQVNQNCCISFIISDDIEVMPIFHPSYLLRNHSLEQGSPRWLMKKDLENVKNKLNELL